VGNILGNWKSVSYQSSLVHRLLGLKISLCLLHLEK
jgi:hypothetical protein